MSEVEYSPGARRDLANKKTEESAPYPYDRGADGLYPQPHVPDHRDQKLFHDRWLSFAVHGASRNLDEYLDGVLLGQKTHHLLIVVEPLHPMGKKTPQPAGVSRLR